MDREASHEDSLNNWEQQYSETIENQENYYGRLARENENFQRRVWSSFQDSATAIAQLYRERDTRNPGKIWTQFQMAAATLTTLYKESCESHKRATELARQSAHQKRNLELLNWAKQERRLIRREDLLLFLARNGRNQNQRQPHRDSATGPPHRLDPNLQMFREALTTWRRDCTPPQQSGADLCSFIGGEVARHGPKRSASPVDDSMGNPQKRPKYM